jgi:hypothetical protein
MESAVMQLGDYIGISARDLDKVHLDVIEQQLNQAAPGLMQKVQQGSPDLEGILKNLQLLEGHAQEHLQSWMIKGGKEAQPQIMPYQQKMQQFTNMLRQGAAELQRFRTKQAAAMQQQAALQGANGQQQPPPGMPEHLLKITSSIDYKSAPDDIKRQIEAMAGLVPSKMGAQAPQPPVGPQPPIGFQSPPRTTPTPTAVPAGV